MGMFLNYQNIADNYIPNNLQTAFPHNVAESKLNPLDASKPYEEYDVKGNLCGYFWRYGETLNLEFQIDGEITVEDDAIILTTAGSIPDQTMGSYVGQRAYNIIDCTSWTCAAIVGDKFVWNMDAEFSYPETAQRSIYISADDYLKDKVAKVTLYNFRMEPIVEKAFPASSKVVFPIDKELSLQLQKGIYYCKVSISNDLINQIVFDTVDCQLVVK